MKCSDIHTEGILLFLSRHQGQWSTYCRNQWMPAVADGMRPDVPWKVMWAKMKRLIHQGLVDGCPCGCRGDFEITNKGLAMIGVARTRRSIYGT